MFHPRINAQVVATLIALLVALGSPPARLLGATLGEVEQAYWSGDYEAVVRISSERVDEGIWNEQWPRWLIRGQLTTGKYVAARATYQAAIKRYPTSLSLRLLGIEALRASGAAELAGDEERQFFRILQSSPSRFTSRDNLIAAGRYFLKQGEDARQVLKLFYDRVRDAAPEFLETYIATAELAIDKGDFQVAADTLARAAQLQQQNPQVHYLLARAWAPSDAARAGAAIDKALELNPRHLPTLLYRVDMAIDGEQYAAADDLLDRLEQVNAAHPEGLAYRAVIANLRGDYEAEKKYREQALANWNRNPLVDYTIGKKLSDKYRFAEGAKYQRRALEFDPKYTAARFQLAQDLLRLGHDEEGWQIARQVAADDQYNVVAHNLITLNDRLREFAVLEGDGIQLRMDAHEAVVYGQDALDLLVAAKQSLCEKYDVLPDAPIVVEIFPEQKDFAIRTFGLPGGAGFLGVCFGRVITANSPASQGPRPANWQSVLWHEFCHVVTLEKTKNRMPRWLSEGISVHEERQRNPSWGEHMTPQYREMLLADELTPISELSAAFLRPPSPLHLQFAYYHSSLVVEYLIEQHGIEALNQVLDDLGDGLTINAALERRTGSIDKLNVQFAEYVKRIAGDFGPQADWDRDGLPDQATTEQLKSWVAEHPASYWGLRRLAQAYLVAGEAAQAKPLLEQLRSLNTTTGDRDGVLEMLARVYQQLDESDHEREVLTELISISSDALPALRRLVELSTEQGDWEQVLKYADQIMAIQPLLPDAHIAMAKAGEQLGRPQYVARALRVLRTMDPVDPALIDFRLATALFDLGQFAEAKHHVIQALVEAPRYRAAHRLLLQIVERAEDE